MSNPEEFFVEVQNYGRDFLLNCASSQLTNMWLNLLRVISTENTMIKIQLVTLESHPFCQGWNEDSRND